MKEIFKDVLGYEDRYQVSNLGNVKSKARINSLTGIEIPEKIKKQNDNGKGYKTVRLYRNNKGATFYVHRLVAIAFVDNPNNKKEVNHIDENKSNNNYKNLSWVTSSENQKWGTKLKRQSETFIKNGKNCNKVSKYDLNGNKIETYYSMREAERANNLSNGAISAYFKFNRSNAGGYAWNIE